MGYSVGLPLGIAEGLVVGTIVGDNVHGVDAKHAWLAGQSTASPRGHAVQNTNTNRDERLCVDMYQIVTSGS